ncbi:hypothetical protein ES332_D10G112400v1 [Gossypium tomentosum]|uniref:Uncharacterized protein n=1 Tax=Gossypium tomentosum TaxID=34277 RepID=A0A5D2J2I5_GOSTO|nr:hypothetical protein ES332_D10G112400v1 [Gossypium tomentosum]
MASSFFSARVLKPSFGPPRLRHNSTVNDGRSRTTKGFLALFLDDSKAGRRKANRFGQPGVEAHVRLGREAGACGGQERCLDCSKNPRGF